MNYRLKYHKKRNDGVYEAFQIKVNDVSKFISFGKNNADMTIDSETYKLLSSNERFKKLFELDVIEVWGNDNGDSKKIKDISNASGISESKNSEEETEETEEVEITPRKSRRRPIS